MTIDAGNLHFRTLNQRIRDASGTVRVENCLGQRYIGSGMQGMRITIHGTPGNALGAYFDGEHIEVFGNAQDAAGDTMNDGRIIIHGSSGDATGYAMRGGKIFIRGSAGYRAGIHMKAYQNKIPTLIVGERTGSFLGEYQAGGHIVVLGIGLDGAVPVGDFCGTGMHGGAIYLRCNELPADLPSQVCSGRATAEDLAEIEPDLREYCGLFGFDAGEILGSNFYVLRPNLQSPYRQLYTHN